MQRVGVIFNAQAEPALRIILVKALRIRPSSLDRSKQSRRIERVAQRVRINADEVSAQCEPLSVIPCINPGGRSSDRIKFRYTRLSRFFAHLKGCLSPALQSRV